MKKHINQIYTTFLFSLMAMGIHAQANTVATGGDGTGSNGSFSYSIGQIDYLNSDSGSHNKNEGNQQPYEFYNVVGITENSIINLVYPNPTSDVVKVVSSQANLSYNIVDAKGKLIWSAFKSENEFLIDFSSNASGTYYLDVLDGKNESVQTIKIIKN